LIPDRMKFATWRLGVEFRIYLLWITTSRFSSACVFWGEDIFSRCFYLLHCQSPRVASSSHPRLHAKFGVARALYKSEKRFKYSFARGAL
jgi:hypothetical protein